MEKEWDSRFFGFPIGAVTLSGRMSEPELRACLKTWRLSGFRLIYVFVDASAARSTGGILESAGAVAVGTRVRYRKLYGPLRTDEARKGLVATTQKNPQLEGLAYLSGACSRFARDERLRPFFRRLYGTWLDKELSSGKVFVFPNADSPVGLATVTLHDDPELGGHFGDIGLVAVEAQHRGKGIARGLMADVEAWLRQKEAVGCDVVTQGENVAARSLYEKVGFQKVSEVGVWHFWVSSQREDES